MRARLATNDWNTTSPSDDPNAVSLRGLTLISIGSKLDAVEPGDTASIAYSAID